MTLYKALNKEYLVTALKLLLIIGDYQEKEKRIVVGFLIKVYL